MQWISEKDCKPKSLTNKVIVCYKNGYVGFGHYEKFHGVEEWYNLESGKPFTEWGEENEYEVTHWMELPKPPSDEDDWGMKLPVKPIYWRK